MRKESTFHRGGFFIVVFGSIALWVVIINLVMMLLNFWMVG